ncbi:MAG: thiamine phosphate synthase [Rikenellaceae bacterium]
MRPQFDLSLYLVTDSSLTRGRKLEDVVEEAAKGGVTIVQLREKELPTGEFIDTARRIKAILDQYSVPLIINDRVDVALAVDAAGVHIGQSDMSYSDARRLLGEDKIIGLSVETFDEVIASNALDVDYIGISPIFQSTTKTDTLSPFGIEGCRKAVEATTHRTVAIGGINLSNLEACFSTGIEGVALVSAIISAKCPYSATQKLREAIMRYKSADLNL